MKFRVIEVPGRVHELTADGPITMGEAIEQCDPPIKKWTARDTEVRWHIGYDVPKRADQTKMTVEEAAKVPLQDMMSILLIGRCKAAGAFA